MASVVIKLFAIFVLIGISVSEGEVAEQIVSDDCLDCICDALSDCEPGLQCNRKLCGGLSSYYNITRPFWIDAGKLTTPGQSPKDSDAYQKCVMDALCAAQTIRGYMKKFGQDCNDDGKINCRDYIAIHIRGGYGCKGDLPAKQLEAFNKCAALKGI